MAKFDLRQSVGLRLFIVGFLTLILLIPALLIQDVIRERRTTRDAAAAEISQKWGAAQTIVGPIVSIPYIHRSAGRDGEQIETRLTAHLLPDELDISGRIVPDVRYRGIYEVVVFNADVRLTGEFPSLESIDLKIPMEDMILEDAYVSLGITDMKGITDLVRIRWNGAEYVADPGIESGDVLSSGISIRPYPDSDPDPGPPGEARPFDLSININGSSGLYFSPVGKETTASLTSDWPHPSFAGDFLPAERSVTSDGFDAEWRVLHLNRNFPQHWSGPNAEVSNSRFGVELLLDVDLYQKTMRTAKYAIMFISLTFLTFIMIELLGGRTIHPVQYLLVGFALLLFYTLLLSISEYLTFGWAYVIASSSVVLLISIYSNSVLGDRLKAGMVFGILILLYGYLYILLQLQDYALLMGSLALFVVLALVMYLTRRIDWFDVMRRSDPQREGPEEAGTDKLTRPRDPASAGASAGGPS